MQATIPQPKPDESCEDYCVRAHRETMKSIPNVDERNQAIWNTWDMARGTIQVERYRAQGRFAGWRTIPDVCHFTEHSTRTKMGELEVGPQQIVEVCKNMNKRTKLGLYPPLINKHTVDKQQSPNEPDPYIVGYGGNYRIGMIDDGETQRYSIFGDEYHKPEHLSELNEKPRRSVELMRYKDSTRNFFDPIACLGAESPRIAMPPAYYSAKDEDGLEVVRYSIAVPVLAGSSNTYVKGFGDKERMQATAEPQMENVQMLSPEDTNQMVDAVKNALAPYLAWIDTKMQQDQGGMQQPAQPGMPAAPGQPGGDNLALGGSPVPSPGSAHTPAPHSPAPAPAPMPHGAPGHGQPMKFSAAQEPVESDEAEQVQYSQLAEQNQTLIQELAETKAKLGALMVERSDAIRAHKLAKLANQYDVIDFDHESQKILYSCGSEMTDEAVDEYLETIERYAAKAAPSMEMLPEGESEDDSEDQDALPKNLERYSASTQAEVVRRMTAHREKYSSYEECEAEVCRELGIK